jgi:cytochrome P450
MTNLEPIDIASAAHKADAHRVYDRLREDMPVCQVMLPTREQAWLVARYDDVSNLLKDQRFAKDPANAMTPEQLARHRLPPKLFAPLMRNMLGMDDPDHARLKKLVQAGFTPKRIQTLAGRTEDSARFARWSHTLLSLPIGSWRMVLSLPDVVQFMRYLRHLVALKRTTPADDLVSALVTIESDGDRLSGDELLAMIAILLSAGHETTTNLIGNGTLALLQSPESLDRLRAEPSLMETAIEELLRYSGPVETSTFRYAREDVVIADTPIPRGGLVLGLITSANRDARQFANADRLDLSRAPNRHLTFGEGGHYCVGAALARLEGRVAFTALLRRMRTLRLDQPLDSLHWRPGMVLRGLQRLQVRAG